MAEATLDQIHRQLAQLDPVELEVEDESSRHAGHPGAAQGGGHFRLRVVSAAFEGLSRLQRHRLVYDRLEALMQREIHALAMTLLSPEEAASAQSHPPPRE